MARQLNEKCNLYKRVHANSGLRIIWSRDHIDPDLPIWKRIKALMILCGSLSVRHFVKSPVYNIGDGTIDSGAVFRNLTHQISIGLENCNYCATSDIVYFEGSLTAMIPSSAREIQIDKKFFFGLGKFFLLTLLHGGTFPILHKSVLTYILGLPDPEQYCYEDVEDLQNVILTSVYSFPIEEFPLSVLQKAQREFSMTPQQIEAIPIEERLTEHQLIRLESLRTYMEMVGEEFNESVERMEDDSSFHLIQYLQYRVTRFVLRERILSSLYEMRRGFSTIPRDELPFTVEEILSGCTTKIRTVDEFLQFVDFSDLRTKNEHLHQLFQEAIVGMTSDELQALLVHVTGSGRVPATFKFCCLREDNRRMPIVHSCFSLIDLYCNRYKPDYVFIKNNEALSGADLLRYDLIMICKEASNFDGSIDQFDD